MIASLDHDRKIRHKTIESINDVRLRFLLTMLTFTFGTYQPTKLWDV